MVSTTTTVTVTNQFHDMAKPQLTDHNGTKDIHKFEGQEDDLTSTDTVLGVSVADTSTSGYKCSAVHSLERDMPDFDYSHLVEELRQRVLQENEQYPGLFSHGDIEKAKTNDWFVARFLLRQKLDVDQAFDMMRRALRFRHESLATSIRRQDFPAEFYQVGGLFGYEPDRKGNRMLYIRVKIHKKIPEISAVLQAYLYYNIQRLDEEADGKGISIVIDCTGGGLPNADMDMLMFLVTTLVNYFPKGLSYLLVHNLPWILKPFWHIAKAWISEEHRQLIKFSNSRTIYEYVDKENLPDFMGGECKCDYKAVPENCTSLEEAAKLWGIEHDVIKRILLKFEEYLPPSTLAKVNDPSFSDETDTDRE